MKYKILSKNFFLCIVFAFVFGIFFYNACNNISGYSSIVSNDTISYENIENIEYSQEDLEETWNDANIVKIFLNDDSISIDGTGASSTGSNITIDSAGTYMLEGTLTNGQVIINAGKQDVVRLILNGVNITCSDNSSIYSIKSGKTILTLAENTINTIIDGSNYIYDNSENISDSAIFSKDSLTINGKGTLNVTGNYKDGIVTKDNLIITAGNININAVNNGLCGRDSIIIKDGTFNINAQNDAIKSNNDEDSTKGWIYIDSGNFNIISNNDAIQAETDLQINYGTFNIVTGGGSIAVNTNKEKDISNTMNYSDSDTSSESSSAKGLKANSNIYINNGDFLIDSYDDSIHSNDSIFIQGGKFAVTSGEDGIHSDTYLMIEGNTEINISKCYEGLESESIVINDGTIYLTSDDDGINATQKQAVSNELQNRNDINSYSSSDISIQINGGYIFVEASGDGIDSNGDLYINDGIVIINGIISNGNGMLDYDGKCEITGGILIASGSSGMLQTPSASSSQNILAVMYSKVQKAGTSMNISDESGNSILTFAPTNDYESIIISSPKLEIEKTYKISSNGYCEGEITNHIYIGGNYYNGNELTNVTLSNVVTTISDSGAEIDNKFRMPNMRNNKRNNSQPRDNQNTNISIN